MKGNSPVELILIEMQRLYGNLFDLMWRGMDFAEMVAYWERKLSGFSQDELRRGFRALDSLKRPPTLPEFKALCRRPVDMTAAYYEAVDGLAERRMGRMGEWSHPAIFWAAISMAFDLRNLSYSAVKARFEARLEKWLAKGAWDPIPEVPSHQLPPPAADRERDREKAQASLQHIRQFLAKAAPDGVAG